MSTLGTDILIVGEEALCAIKPDYYLVLPWHFKEEFRQSDVAAIKQDIKSIFPLPNIEIA